MTVIFRESRKQCPFELEEVWDLVRPLVATAADTRYQSPNRRWRWGFLECLGGLPARDNTFGDASPQQFDGTFWDRVFRFISVAPEYREPVRKQLRKAAEDYNSLLDMPDAVSSSAPDVVRPSHS